MSVWPVRTWSLFVAANLLARNFSEAAPDRVWIVDFIYIAANDGWLYLAAAIDLF